MSMTELAVITIGLLLGYWLVSFFFKSGPKRTDPPPGELVPSTPQAAEPTVPPPLPAAWHEVLQIAPTASIEEIRTAYFNLAEQYRHDKVQSLGPGFSELAAQKRAEIEVAYQDALQERVPRP